MRAPPARGARSRASRRRTTGRACGRPAAPGGLEQRVVAEPAVAPQRRGDAAAARAPPDQDPQAAARPRLAREREGEHAHVAGAAPIGGSPASSRSSFALLSASVASGPA